jgi:hypothetical protein
LKKVRGKVRKGDVPKLAFKGFGTDQVWAQIVHHTEQVNNQMINNLNGLIDSEDFLREIAELSEDDQEEDDYEIDEDDDKEGDDEEDENVDADEYGEELENELDDIVDDEDALE